MKKIELPKTEKVLLELREKEEEINYMNKEQTITLNPKDYIVLSGGLKIENILDNATIKFELDKYKIIYNLPSDFNQISTWTKD